MAYRIDTDALTVGLPWAIDEIEAAHDLFGPQIWDYSIEGSRKAVDALSRPVAPPRERRGALCVEYPAGSGGILERHRRGLSGED